MFLKPPLIINVGRVLIFPCIKTACSMVQVLGDVLRGIWRYCRPVAIKGAQTLLKASSEATKGGATVKEV